MEVYAKTLINALLIANKKLAVAESCTGGLIAKLCTDVPGSSGAIELCAVTYANAAKTMLLGVPSALLETVGAVSSPVVCRMAKGMKRLAGADIAIAVSGIAGPGGETPDKPVGTVFIAVCCEHAVWVKHCRFDPLLGREGIRTEAARIAIEMAMKALEHLK